MPPTRTNKQNYQHVIATSISPRKQKRTNCPRTFFPQHQLVIFAPAHSFLDSTTTVTTSLSCSYILIFGIATLDSYLVR
jgi:hypothetical protein